MKESDIILVEYVKIAPNREKVVRQLDGGAMTPKDLSLACNLIITSVYKYIHQLLDEGLIYQVNAPARRNKQYALTEKGEHINGLLDKPYNV